MNTEAQRGSVAIVILALALLVAVAAGTVYYRQQGDDSAQEPVIRESPVPNQY